MKLRDFINMDEMEQAEAIWDGVHVADRDDREYKIILYQIDSFYVEVFYHKEHNVIKKYRPFSDPKELDPYLNQINISNRL